MRQKQKILFISVLGILCVSLYLLSWSPALKVADTSGDSKNSSISIDSGGNVYSVWADNSVGDWEIYFKRNFDQTGNAVKRLTWMSGASSNPDITDSSLWNLHLVWQESLSGNTEIFYKNSTDAGSNWSPVKRMTWTAGGSMNPVIAADSNGYLHLVWLENRSGSMQLHYKKSIDAGSNWSNVKRLIWTTGSAYLPQIFIDSLDNIHVVWEDDSSGSSEIYYKKSTDGGNTWSISKRITWNINDSQVPDIVVDSGGNIHIVYKQFSAPVYISYKKSTDGGVTWGQTLRLNWAGPGYNPVIDVDSNGDLHVVWHESVGANDEIFYKTSTNTGSSWSSRVRLTWNSEDSQFCAMTIDNSDIVWVVWEDGPFGDKDIYWKISK